MPKKRTRSAVKPEKRKRPPKQSSPPASIEVDGTVTITPETENPAQALLTALSRGLQVICEGFPAPSLLNFAEALDLSSQTFKKAIIFRHCVFERHFDASNARFQQTLQFYNCAFKESVTFRGSKIEGALHMEDCEVHLPENWHDAKYADDRISYLYEPPPDWRSAKWDGLTISGDLRASRLTVWGSLNLGSANVSGNLYLQGCVIGQFPQLAGDMQKRPGRLYMRQARIEGDVELGPWIPEEKNVEPRGTQIHGSFSLGSSIIKGRLTLRGAKIHGCLHGIMAHISGRLLADCWRDPDRAGTTLRTSIGIDPQSSDSINFQDTTFHAAVWLNGVHTEGRIVFENATIAGSLRLDCWHRPVGYSPLSARSPGDDEARDGKASEFAPSSEKNKTYTEQRREVFPLFRDQPFYQTWLGSNKDGESVCLRNARIQSNLEMNGIRTAGRISCHGTTVSGNIHCMAYELKGEKSFARPDIRFCNERKSFSLYGASVGGNIEFRAAVFHGAVRMRYARVSGAIDGNRLDHEVDGKVWWTKIGVSKAGYGLYLYGATIEGNLCCKSIRISGQMSLELATIKGMVDCRESKITGHVPTQKEDERREEIEAVAKSGAVCLELAHIANTVMFEGSHFGGNIKANGMAVGDNLEADCVTMVNKRHKNAPKEIELDGVEVSGDLTLGVSGASKITAKGIKVGDDMHVKCLTTETLILSGSSIRHLTMDLKCPLDQQKPLDQPELKIQLAYSRLGTLRFEDFEECFQKSSRRKIIDLDGMVFNHLDVEKVSKLTASNRSEEKDNFSHYPVSNKLSSRRISTNVFLGRLAFFLFSGILTCIIFGVGAESAGGPPPSLSASLIFTVFYFIAVTVCFSFLVQSERLGKNETPSRFAGFLASMRRFSHAPYSDVQNMLERLGDTEEAKHVYGAMRQREILEGKERLSTLVFRWIFFIAAGSGVRVGRLCLFLICYFLFSWWVVFSNPDSVEHPSTFVAHEIVKEVHNEGIEKVWSERTGQAAGTSWRDRPVTEDWPFVATNSLRGEHDWDWRDGFWMALKVHVPLLHLWWKEKWSAASTEGSYFSACGLRKMHFGLEYETYAVIAQIISYLTIPMLISAIGGFYKKHESGSHGHGGGHGH